MTRITAKSANQSLEFDAIHFDASRFESDVIDNIIVTEINPVTDLISDHCFKAVTLTKNIDDSISFVSDKESEKVGIFMLVSLMSPEKDTLMGIFEEYDGSVIAYSEKTTLTTHMQFIDREKFKESIFVVTGYNEGQHRKIN